MSQDSPSNRYIYILCITQTSLIVNLYEVPVFLLADVQVIHRTCHKHCVLLQMRQRG